MAERAPVRIANCSGFYGDRLSAAREMIDGGPIDVLTGDWLAELTMLILARQRMKRGAGSGYAGTFLKQMRDVLADCLERQIKVVTNAGGLDPQGLADALRALATEVGLEPRIGVVTGDDLAPAIDELVGQGESFTNLDTGESFADLGVTALTANAYLGGSGIAAALAAGADLVVCGRVTDAALVIGPAAWWHGWSFHEAESLDPLAGALVAGHVIECGAQATGGNYAFFAEVPGLEHPGFPIAEVSADGSTVITKHPGTGGLVSTGTVTAQLLYEIGDPLYQNPDVTADFRTLHLEQDDPDRVRISGVRGFPPPERLKVSLNYLGGFRNSMSLVLTGLDIEGKADLALRTICGIGLDQIESEPRELADASSLPVRELSVQLIRGDRPDPRTFAEAQAHLRITVKADQPDAVGRAFTGPAIETALATYPGMFVTAPPAPGTPFGVFWPTTIARKKVKQRVYVEDVGSGTRPIEGVGTAMAAFVDFPPVPTPAPRPSSAGLSRLSGRTESRPLGLIVGARSGDKGGNANIGLWIPDTGAQPDLSYAWLADLFSGPDSVWALIPESRGCPVEIHMLPNLRALNVVVKGLLGRGVNENTLLDPQAKGLGEFLRARTVQIPVEFLAVEAGPA